MAQLSSVAAPSQGLKANKAPAECYDVPNPPTNASAYCMKISWQGWHLR